jgi:hypothetical protein
LELVLGLGPELDLALALAWAPGLEKVEDFSRQIQA